MLWHIYATLLVAAGVPISVTQQQLGHQDVSTTMRYAHVIEGATHMAAERLDAFVTSRGRGAERGARGHHLGTDVSQSILRKAKSPGRLASTGAPKVARTGATERSERRSADCERSEPAEPVGGK